MAVKYKFFWGGEFSNWCPSDFTLDDITYNCGEQYMMYQKAMLFGDTEMAQKIMDTRNPSEQKKMGRLVKGFKPKAWDAVKYDIVKRGLREKFLQNPTLKEYLLKHKGYQMVEASPEDRIWGIGYRDVDALNNIHNWGENLLGKILTELSNEIE